MAVKEGGNGMKGDLFWDLFPLTFLNVDYGTSLLFNWGGAVILGFVLIFLSQKGLATKGFVYFAMGIVSLVYIAIASTAGLQYLAVFLSVAFLWLTTDYILITVTEWRLVSWREFRDFMFPYFYKWFEEKEEKKESKFSREVNEDDLSYWELVKEGYCERFPWLKKMGVKKPKAPLTMKQIVKIQLWFILGTVLFIVLIALSGGYG